jgi:hypothetical protein
LKTAEVVDATFMSKKLWMILSTTKSSNAKGPGNTFFSAPESNDDERLGS